MAEWMAAHLRSENMKWFPNQENIFVGKINFNRKKKEHTSENRDEEPPPQDLIILSKYLVTESKHIT